MSALSQPRWKRWIHKVRTHPHPARYVMARILAWSGLCQFWYIQREGYRLRFHPSSVSMALWEYPEGWRRDSQVLKQLLRPGDVYVDVGANIGHLVIEAAQCVGERGQVYAFEAHPRITTYLRENVALNRLNNVRVAQIAIGDRIDWVTLSDLRADDMNRIVQDGNVPHYTVLMLPLDLVCAHVSPTLLKVDVEGYEWFVFRGASQLLDRTAFVYFEMWDEHQRQFEKTFADLYDLLGQHGFQIGFLLEGGIALVEREQTFPCNVNLLAFRDDHLLQQRTGWRLLGTQRVTC